MLASPKFIAIDDNVNHLNSIVTSFEHLGSYCAGIHYKPEEAISTKKPLFRGVRALFLDFHLLSSIAASDHTQHSAHIAALIEDVIHEDGGPYAIILWSSQIDVYESLKKYLTDNLEKSKPYLQPFGIFPLEKETFINLTHGTTNNPEALKAAIKESLQNIPQLAVLMEWEADVVNSAREVLTDLKRLAIRQSVTDIPGSVDAILSHLASAAVGEKNVATDPRSALNAAISPVLFDKILNQKIEPNERTLWDRAITKSSTAGNLTIDEIGQYNKMLHLSLPSSEKIETTSWGVVVDFKNNQYINEIFYENQTLDEIQTTIKEEFKVRPEDFPNCNIFLIKSGAACDHAQKQRGPNQYFLALKVPSASKESSKRGPAIWTSPSFKIENNTCFKILVHARYSISVPLRLANSFEVKYRFREQLQNEMVTHLNNYLSRPGKISLF